MRGGWQVEWVGSRLLEKYPAPCVGGPSVGWWVTADEVSAQIVLYLMPSPLSPFSVCSACLRLVFDIHGKPDKSDLRQLGNAFAHVTGQREAVFAEKSICRFVPPICGDFFAALGGLHVFHHLSVLVCMFSVRSISVCLWVPVSAWVSWLTGGGEGGGATGGLVGLTKRVGGLPLSSGVGGSGCVGTATRKGGRWCL